MLSYASNLYLFAQVAGFLGAAGVVGVGLGQLSSVVIEALQDFIEAAEQEDTRLIRVELSGILMSNYSKSSRDSRLFSFIWQHWSINS